MYKIKNLQKIESFAGNFLQKDGTPLEGGKNNPNLPQSEEISVLFAHFFLMGGSQPSKKMNKNPSKSPRFESSFELFLPP